MFTMNCGLLALSRMDPCQFCSASRVNFGLNISSQSSRKENSRATFMPSAAAPDSISKRMVSEAREEAA